MTPEEFKVWRKAYGLTQALAADMLGVSRGTVENYETGVRREDGREVKIPVSVELACHLLSLVLAAEGRNNFLPTEYARRVAREAIFRLSEPSGVVSPTEPRREFPTRHEALRSVGLIPEGELSLREMLDMPNRAAARTT